jgi:hypothetical protein
MRFRAKIVHVVVAGLPVAGCTTTESDTKTTPKTDTATKTTPPDVKEAKETKKDPQPDTPKIPTIVVETPEDIPVPLAGVAMPYTPPVPDGKAAPAPAPPAAPAPSAAAAAAPAEPAAIAMGPTGIELGHDHPPGEPCKPMRREEVEKALADLKK